MLRTKYDEKIVQMGIYIKKTLFWNFFIRSFLQSFLSQSIWIIGFYMPQSPLITSKNKKAKMYTATFVMLLLIPATLIYLM
jgi:fatty acid desaturase